MKRLSLFTYLISHLNIQHLIFFDRNPKSDLYDLKRNTILILTLFLPLILFCQKPFAPLGAKWGGVVDCTPCTWSCPPGYPYYYIFEVTEDTIIQDKYCTLINDPDWNFWNEQSIVHQDGHQIYRYDRATEEFKLVLDFSKEVGESWQIEVPDFWANTDTLTITVLEKVEAFRQVSINGIYDNGEYPLFSCLDIHEGFGGFEKNLRLLLGDELFIITDPYIWDELTCYINPVEGLLYGNASACELTNTTAIQDLEKVSFNVYPNPASTHIILDYEYPYTKSIEWSLSDIWGQKVKSEILTSSIGQQYILIEGLANGVYFWSVQAEAKIIDKGTVVVNR